MKQLILSAALLLFCSVTHAQQWERITLTGGKQAVLNNAWSPKEAALEIRAGANYRLRGNAGENGFVLAPRAGILRYQDDFRNGACSAGCTEQSIVAVLGEVSLLRELRILPTAIKLLFGPGIAGHYYRTEEESETENRHLRDGFMTLTGNLILDVPLTRRFSLTGEGRLYLPNRWLLPPEEWNGTLLYGAGIGITARL